MVHLTDPYSVTQHYPSNSSLSMCGGNPTCEGQSGAPTCDATTMECQCGSASACTSTSAPTCNEGTSTCECSTNPACVVGSGMEVCEESSGACVNHLHP